MLIIFFLTMLFIGPIVSFISDMLIHKQAKGGYVMLKFIVFMQAFMSSREDEDRGATMVEYGIMVAAIAVVVSVAAFALGDKIVALFDGITL